MGSGLAQGARTAIIASGFFLATSAAAEPRSAPASAPARVRIASEDSRVTLRGDLPLGDALNQLARSAKLTLVADKDVQTGKPVTLNLEDTPFPAALASVLTPLGYGFTIEPRSGILRVFVYESQTFKIAVPILTQNWFASISNEAGGNGGAGGGASGGSSGGASSSGSGSGGASGLGARVSLESRSDSEGLWKEIEKSLEQMVGKDGTYSVNRVAGFATVRTFPSVMRGVASYFDALNAEMGRTVSVEAKVLQVDLRDRRAAGINWTLLVQRLAELGPYVDASLPASSILPDGTGVLHLAGAGGEAFIRALEEQGDLKLVAQPTLVLGNNLPAIIEVGTVQNYVSEQSVTIAQGGTAQITVKTASISDGLILSILPRLLDGGDIALALATVSQDILEVRREDFESGFVDLPKTSRRSYSGVVRARAGQSLVVGGLISDRLENRRTGLPFLARIPFIGWMFGARDRTSTRSELVITITPRSVSTASSNDRDAP